MTPDASHGLVHYIDSPHARVERAVSSQSAGAIILVRFCENSPIVLTWSHMLHAYIIHDVVILIVDERMSELR